MDRICFCDACVEWSGDQDDNDDRRPPLYELTILDTYPKYDWVPPSLQTHINSTPDFESERQEEQLERAIHRYLQRLGRLPRPLPDMRDCHLAMLPSRANPARVKESASARGLLDKVAAEARQCQVLWIVMCGHGGHAADLVMADGSRVSLSDVADALVHAKFSGTVVVSLNACYAEPLWCNELCSKTWPAQLPFRWVLLFSCGAEAQKPSHADHFARMLGRLASERPIYSELQARADELWVSTRHPDEKPSMWRRPPRIEMGGRYGGALPGTRDSALRRLLYTLWETTTKQ